MNFKQLIEISEIMQTVTAQFNKRANALHQMIDNNQ